MHIQAKIIYKQMRWSLYEKWVNGAWLAVETRDPWEEGSGTTVMAVGSRL